MSLILVFATVLFGIRYPTIQADIAEEIPAGPAARARHRKKLLSSFLFNSLPLIVVSGGSSFLFSPLIAEILKRFTLSIGDFDLVVSAFVFFTILLLAMFLWSLYLGFQLLSRRAEVGKT